MTQMEQDSMRDVRPSRGVEVNRRLTGITAIPLLMLLFVEGMTVLLGVSQLISVHVYVGMLLVPPIALKIASVGYRFVRNTRVRRRTGWQVLPRSSSARSARSWSRRRSLSSGAGSR